jgi:hypothetical protein
MCGLDVVLRDRDLAFFVDHEGGTNRTGVRLGVELAERAST